MAIKDSAYKTYFVNHSLESRLAEHLDEAFDVTFGNTWGGISFWLSNPKPNVRERFGLQKEVLTIYSPHISTDARVLTAIEGISRSPDFKHRIEKVLYLLIYSGSQEETDRISKSDPDKIIVPFAASELENPQKGPLFLRSRIAERFGDIDLFGMSSPITSDHYFYGRENLVQELVVRSTSKAQNSGLFGLRKTGKTSVLWAVQRRLSNQRVLTEYIDCHNPGIHSSRWWHVLENISERLSIRLQKEYSRYASVQKDYNPVNCGTRFSSDIQTILKDGMIDKIILLLDEIEFITPTLSGALGRHWDSDFLPFWQTIRSTHHEAKGKLIFIVAGVNPAAVEETRFNNTPNPIFQLALPYFLEPFDRKGVREMVRTLGRYAGAKFEETVFDHLTEKFGGHPYLIRIACSQVWRELNKNLPQALCEILTLDFIKRHEVIKDRLAQPIKDILLSLVWWYPEEYQLLQMLANGESQFVSDYIKESPGSLLKFAKYGLLKGNNLSSFAIDDLKEFMVQNGDNYKNEISPFLRGDLPPELLPEIPDLGLLSKLFEKRVEIESKLRKVIIFYLGVHNDWDNKKISEKLLQGLRRRSDRKNPASLFMGATPQSVMEELYLLDLKDIITNNWDVFCGLFDQNKSRFEMNMDTINLVRKTESHTGTFTEAEKADYIASCAWIIRHLEKVPNI